MLFRSDEKQADYFNARALVRIAMKDPARAIADFSEAIRLDPEFAAARLNRADLYRQQGDQDRAIADYGSVVGVRDSQPRLFNCGGGSISIGSVRSIAARCPRGSEGWHWVIATRQRCGMTSNSRVRCMCR